MDAYYLSADIGDDSALCIAPLTRRAAEAAGEAWANAGGYFLFKRGKRDREDIEILARLESEDAALDLASMLKLR